LQTNNQAKSRRPNGGGEYIESTSAWLRIVHHTTILYTRICTQDALSTPTFNSEEVLASFLEAATHYKPNSKQSDTAPWKHPLFDEDTNETLRTQFEINTHGITVPRTFIEFVKDTDDQVLGRCGLCYHDCRTSISRRVRKPLNFSKPLPCSAMTNIAQHAVSRGHQIAVNRLLKGARDALKNIATEYAVLLPDESERAAQVHGIHYNYEMLVNHCRRRQLLLAKERTSDKDTPRNSSIFSSNTPTPTTIRHLSKFENLK